MNDLELIVKSERRFGRLRAYEAILHWASLGVMWLGTVLFALERVPGWVSLVCFALSAATRALWCKVLDAEERQHALVMADEWEELERLIEP